MRIKPIGLAQPITPEETIMNQRNDRCVDRAGKRMTVSARLALSTILVLSLVLLLSTVANAAYVWTSTGSPSTGGNSVRCLTLDQTHNILYAGADTGEVYRYQSGAWSTTGGPSAQTAINDIEYDPVSNTVVAALYVNSTFEVWTYQEGGTWTLTNSTVGNDNPSSVASDGAQKKLYACTYGGAAWEYDYQTAPGPWASIGNPQNGVRCLKMDAARHVLYAGGSNGTSWPITAAVSRYDGANWSPFGSSFGVGLSVSCLAQDSSRNVLYAGTWTNTTGELNVFRRNIDAGGDWVGIGALCGGPEIFSLAIDEVNNTLYALAYDGHVYKNCDASVGNTWLDIGRVSPNTLYNTSLQYDPASATLFCGSTDGQVYSQGISALTSLDPPTGAQGQRLDVDITATNSAFTAASKVVFSGDGVIVNSTTVLGPNKIRADISIKPDTYLGPRNVLVKTGGDKTNKLVGGFNVTEPQPLAWYLAEGTNAWGFSTYITIENPYDNTVRAKLTYMDPTPPAAGKGILATRALTLPPLSQTTVSSVSDIGSVDFATKVESLEGQPIAVDRTMFWTGEGSSPAQSGYHSSIGTTTPSKTWYLPEGSSAWGFETWTLLLNPNPSEANITLTYMTADGPTAVHKTIPANSRATCSMAQDIGKADASIEVTSDVPVVAERSVYKNDRREGSCSIGATAPSTDYFLAEGATGYDVGFTTYVLIQNPQNSPNDVSLTYQTAAGEVKGPSFTMKPNTRKTVRVNDTLPPNTDVSTLVHGEHPVIAERAMYWDNGTGTAFHASIGLDSPHMVFLLPDGQTSAGFETWTLVENPNPGTVSITVTYMPQGGGQVEGFKDEIPANSRRSYNVADKVPSGRASIYVQSLDGARPIIVERAMYMNNRGAGTDTIGGFLELNR
jgi:hypothetical protein